MIKKATAVDLRLMNQPIFIYSFGDDTVGEYFQTIVLCCPNAYIIRPFVPIPVFLFLPSPRNLLLALRPRFPFSAVSLYTLSSI